MNFWPDFIKLKTSIGGNRELVGYEETFGMPIEEKMRITAPNRHNKRLISQLEFAIRLNDETVMTYKPCIARTADSGAGFGFGYQKSAEKKLVYQLEEFKRLIGSDLPIVKINKI